MNPWWKRPSSESSSTASREADKRSRPQRSNSDDDGGSDNSGGGSRRRRGRRGGRGRSQEGADKTREQGNANGNKRSRGGRGRGGSRRGRRGGRGRSNAQTLALLVDVEALHKALKAAGKKPDEAVVELFSSVGKDVARRAVASGMRKQKTQKALAKMGFGVERIDGGGGAARLCLALDAMELSLGNRGAKLFMLADTQDDDGEGRRSAEMKLLAQRLGNQGSDVTYFTVDEPLVLGGDEESDDDAACDSKSSGRSDDSTKASDRDARQDGSDSNANDGETGGRRRRRRGRRGRDDAGDAESTSAEATADSDNTREPKPRGRRGRRSSEAAAPAARKSTSEPLSLLTAAIGKLAATESQLVWATKVRQEMSAIDPLFSEAEHGYDDFDALLREAERRGRIALQKDPRTSTFVIVGWRAA